MTTTHADTSQSRNGLPLAATLGALGVVYGDIGTSPLYALKEAAKAAAHGGPLAPDAVLGVASLILWALITIISLKYALLILRADNRGEGGIVALLALLSARNARPGTWRAHLLLVGLVGAALLYGDGAITPAISVLSAVEGLKVDAPSLAPAVVPLTVVILIGLFIMQKKGTGFIGGIFGPVMLCWFFAIGLLGIYGIAHSPGVLVALSPYYAVDFLLHQDFHISFAILGAAFLAVTGGEAMYADMGHFGRMPIRLAWFAIALPALVLNYFGQAGLLISDPTAIDNPFYQLSPDWAHYPLVAFATLATVIASQAIISGAFSLTQQSIQLGFLPRMQIRHTASHEIGQIYVPLVNWLLAAATLGAVLGFGTSDALAGAYGIAVSLLMAITTLLAALVAIQWGYPPIIVIAVNGFFFVIDCIFFAANGTKLFEGGWFPLLLAGAVAFLMLTWRSGVRLVEAARAKLRQPEEELIETAVSKCQARLPGAAVFLASSPHGVPLALTQFVKHNHALHERVLIVTVLIEEAPRIPDAERVEIVEIVPGITRVILHFGFMQYPTISEGLDLACRQGKLPGLDLDDVSYYIGRETIIPTEKVAGMAVWRESVFAFLQRNAERSAAFFGVPTKQVVEFGTEIEI
ncbi:KUP/HAK/KT family potassium transporter [Bradyrhizobium sp. U87765 SZCCT0131]|uniref:potassium transporter Kup n=1 Tax=unclassified Bradyrhizobium TaxID=2631580 RepID=UPI001BA67ACD|nr:MULTISPECIES: KUP/HAK/KT family potassium transporter [unclassified Bradyrhizobium]MBR1217556.1 KUP/HAK/KT family potassium transporter [Bradyrhizobium sp. U87765 SZCCT0131]MBR1264846.1 KUP/HAK/KT family potassium transporter [Bradyrhizobium sp. U87765 SZCCT0134]MBR1304828.1 KUP/HAK/KT family potassium transporter [Bradyrhizobium sp. U87765 SZCCT0110]MBR1320615.1 KUP/HAK/KT family potassium transporter [Bradyrhizobium sp. U87765 SZCCT0109]MBR1349035.1 KUP/HAK/KT family potassium transporter